MIGLGDRQEERIPELVMSEFLKRDGSVQTVSERVERAEKALIAVAKTLGAQNSRQGELMTAYLEKEETAEAYPVLTSTNMVMIKYRLVVFMTQKRGKKACAHAHTRTQAHTHTHTRTHTHHTQRLRASRCRTQS